MIGNGQRICTCAVYSCLQRCHSTGTKHRQGIAALLWGIKSFDFFQISYIVTIIVSQPKGLRSAKVGTLLLLLQTVLLQPDALDGNEASGIHRAEVVECVHRRLLLAVELLGLTAAAKDVCVTLVQCEADLTVDTALREQQAVLDKLTLRREVHAIVQLVAPVVRDELIAQVADLCVHDQTLKIQMCEAKDGHGGRVVATAGLQTDETILDDIDTADAVHVTELVERDEELDRLGVSLVGCDELGRDTLLEVNGDVGGLVRGDKGRLSHGPHVIGRRDIGILENTC